MDLPPISNHPSSAVLLDHASGTLSFPHRCVVETHLRHCSQCRDTIAFLDEVAAQVLDARRVAPPSDLLDRCLASIGRHDTSGDRVRRRADSATTVDGTVLPPSLDGVRPGRARWLAPGLRHCTLWKDDRNTLHYVRVKAGTALPTHRHGGLELTCVLSGSFRGNGTLYSASDVAEEEDDERRAGVEDGHQVVAEPPDDCVCIMATTGRLRFDGRMARLLQPVMPF